MEFIKKEYFRIFIILIFILGVVLRFHEFIIFRSLWRDEASLALSIYFGNFLDLWQVLPHTQSAPPIFMTICKLFNLINPLYPEYFLRLFPFICGILSIYFFFLITKKIFESNLAIIVSNFLFAINTQLIYYSHEFKQYSVDVMVVLGCIFYLSRLDILHLNKKRIFLNAILLSIVPLLSLPSIFAVASWFIVQVCKRTDIKKLLMLAVPTVVVNFLYYLFILKPSQEIMLDKYDFLWKNGFLTFDINSIVQIIKNNSIFYFQQNFCIAGLFLLAFLGFLFILKRRTVIDKIILTAFILVILASLFSIYPILGRVSLYLLPLVIMFLVVPLDFCKKIWIKILYVILLFSFLFLGSKYCLIKNNENPAYMMQILKSNYQEGDFVIYNDVSDSQYKIYSRLYDFKVPNNRLGGIQLSSYGEKWYYSVLDFLPKNQRYWFYYSYDINEKPVIPFLKNWAHKNGKILYENFINNKSYLLYIQL